MMTHFRSVTSFFFYCSVALSLSASAQQAKVLADVAYGEGVNRKMDVYLAEGRNRSTPLVVLIHGGGWMSGDKQDADFMKERMVKNQINVINMNYRLGNDVIHYTDMMSDIHEALRFVRAHASAWNVRKNHYLLWGGSAGGHLALLYAYRYDKENMVSAVITLGAPVKLNQVDHFQKAALGLLPIVAGKAWNGDSTDVAFTQASPYYSARFKPTLMAHGEADSIVSIRQSALLAGVLKKNGVAYQFISLPNGAHGGEGAPQEMIDRLNDEMIAWIKKYTR